MRDGRQDQQDGETKGEEKLGKRPDAFGLAHDDGVELEHRWDDDDQACKQVEDCVCRHGEHEDRHSQQEVAHEVAAAAQVLLQRFCCCL